MCVFVTAMYLSPPHPQVATQRHSKKDASILGAVKVAYTLTSTRFIFLTLMRRSMFLTRRSMFTEIYVLNTEFYVLNTEIYVLNKEIYALKTCM